MDKDDFPKSDKQESEITNELEQDNILEEKVINVQEYLGIKQISFNKTKQLIIEIDDTLLFKDKNVVLEIIERNNKEKFKTNVEVEGNILKVDLKGFIDKFGDVKKRWDIVLVSDNDEENKEGVRYKLGIYNKVFESKFERHIIHESLGNKQNMYMNIYITVKNDIAFFIDSLQKYYNEKFPCKFTIQDFNMSSPILEFNFNITSKEKMDFDCKYIELVWRNAIEERKEYHFEVEETAHVNYTKKYRVKVDLSKIQYELFYWDFFAVLSVNDETIKVRVKNPNKKVVKKIDNEVIQFTYKVENEYIVYPYITGNNCLSIAYRSQGEYETVKYKRREKIAYYIYKIFEKQLYNKNIWLIYEKFSETAQDNSYYFYKYCCDNYPEKNIYYVMNKKSPDYSKLDGYTDKVVDFMSIKHLVYLAAARLLVSSESKGHCYAWRVQTGKIKKLLNKKKMVFLQHGVTAMKRVDYVFKKTAANKVDLFIATSDYEKEIIKKYFNYDEEEIIITGFTRWDVMKDKSHLKDKKVIFLMPTWRNWLDDVTNDVFIQSNYFKNYISLINSKKLSKLLEENDLTIKYFVHPKFKTYLDEFTTKSDRIKIIQPGEEAVNEMMMESSLIITDYSSVAFDFYYQKKPVLFFHFDIDDYNKYQGSYIDMKEEIFGEVAYNSEELVDLIQENINRDFKEKEKYAEMRKKYFKFVDNENSKRVYEEINSKIEMLEKGTKKPTTLKHKIKKRFKKIMKKIKKKFKI